MKYELEQLTGEKIDDAVTLENVVGQRANLEDDKGHGIAAGIQAATAHLPDLCKPAAKPAVGFAGEDARAIYQVVPEFAERAGSITYAPAERASS